MVRHIGVTMAVQVRTMRTFRRTSARTEQQAANMTIEQQLTNLGVVPLVQADVPETAIEISRALLAGGLSIIEIVLRSEDALHCLAAVSKAVPQAVVGAGTVLTAEQAQAAVSAGSRFIVSPGLDDAVVRVANAHGLPVFPGVTTASELQHAYNLGLRTVKFFPAALAGGAAMIKALSSAFREMRFMPTGGISAANLADYLALPSVVACGGSWLTPAAAVEKGDFGRITELAAEAVAIARAR
jgi:2-dehydro-3-deoxyphosphogluconate aldolase/(4S)-4-hydroxy-2-oxoglutarate aldolase